MTSQVRGRCLSKKIIKIRGLIKRLFLRNGGTGSLRYSVFLSGLLFSKNVDCAGFFSARVAVVAVTTSLPDILFTTSSTLFALKVRILRVLQHSNVVYVHQFFKDDLKYYYVVMEHMAGGELFDRIVQKVRLL